MHFWTAAPSHGSQDAASPAPSIHRDRSACKATAKAREEQRYDIFFPLNNAEIARDFEKNTKLFIKTQQLLGHTCVFDCYPLEGLRHRGRQLLKRVVRPQLHETVLQDSQAGSHFFTARLG